MIKFSTRLPFCACFHPTWIGGKQQGSLGKLWLAETWKMVCCYWPYSHWCPLLNLNKVAILTHYFYNVTHFFQTWNLAQSDILPKWFSWKKNCVNTRPSSDFSRCHTKSPSQFHCARGFVLNTIQRGLSELTATSVPFTNTGSHSLGGNTQPIILRVFSLCLFTSS